MSPLENEGNPSEIRGDATSALTMTMLRKLYESTGRTDRNPVTEFACPACLRREFQARVMLRSGVIQLTCSHCGRGCVPVRIAEGAEE